MSITIDTLVRELNMNVLAGKQWTCRELAGAYPCDLLSWVMAHINSDFAWVTVHTHVNIIAVAKLTGIPCVIIPENIDVEPYTLKKAEDEEVVLLGTSMNSYEICTSIYDLLREKKNKDDVCG